jgi:hypothetical protein
MNRSAAAVLQPSPIKRAGLAALQRVSKAKLSHDTGRDGCVGRGRIHLARAIGGARASSTSRSSARSIDTRHF